MNAIRKLILIIDDDLVIRESLGELLELMDFPSLEAEDGPTAISLFKERHTEIELVFLDLTMPGMTGDIVLTRLQEIDPEVKVVLMSGFNQSETVKHFTHMKPTGFLTKPFDVETILSLIGEIFRANPDDSGSGHS